MAVNVFSSTGCIRCEIVKRFLKDQGIEYIDFDIKTPEGDAKFKAFYRENRKNVNRDSNGIFFPLVLLEDGTIVQDAGSTLSHLIAGNRLDKMIRPNQLGHGWTGGIDISAGTAADADDFIKILTLLKKGGLFIEMETSGLNAEILERALSAKLVDRLIFNVPINEGCDNNVHLDETIRSLKIANMHTGAIDIHYLAEVNRSTTKEHLGEAARLMFEATECNTLPLKIYCSKEKGLNLLTYRTAARRWQVLTDIKK